MLKNIFTLTFQKYFTFNKCGKPPIYLQYSIKISEGLQK